MRTARYAYFEHRRANARSLAEGIAAPIGAGRTTDRELYDLRDDPFQLASRARDPRYRPARRRLAVLVARLERCSGTECVVRARVPGPSR